MIALRSVLFNTIFYANLIIRMIVLSPYYFVVPRKIAYAIPKNWARSNHWLMRVIVGTTFEIEGLENLPDGSYILAPKHQSFWDTYALLPWLKDPVYILKRELMWIPLFGWYAKKQRMIPVDRGARGKVMVEVLKRTKEELSTGRQLIIYPEGTRRPPGAEPLYKYGIARMYRDLNLPVVPVAMHPGLFWPRRSIRRYPGHFKVRILPPIMPGMDPDAFFTHLIEVSERASDELLLETVERNPHLPLPPTAVERLVELRKLNAATG
ncbi:MULTISPECIES: lysophospholipid acyltransferase family protein [Rhizobium]|uniref:1-acyl-sn-glycerol-3-phosphate acyltransferase n=1 Tax=Rhizobium indicum TaxID=2583231 RepID=A0ABX6PF56_9HYPH|nr:MULTISPECIES: 1-acyl-sn-glycerol-3-phosphate acyltransferase [Rhizobium]MBA1346742.1 1-acyl-sn-glycerol-3-phosphate acyltransferase [Rhizobium sp. WYCCWR 11146]NNU69043.1 1-acyl-sn-glycerol-3-phosphate acyltransferase [Rhizobium sp. WYCCWR 11152]NYT31205.1 1-acyl-sn-glycerol-3-phosphate acyltransferase [Rhizobium sp. WYCCWR 11128]QKK17735.1 1-acyl-sn-glycerol-3-phosphate acyltransferase [Rhizobium indicum]QKK30893.1 1-acyl-sn-glycerol-3-phosphate acyltransferase [Rhizobium indicum]